MRCRDPAVAQRRHMEARNGQGVGPCRALSAQYCLCARLAGTSLAPAGGTLGCPVSPAKRVALLVPTTPRRVQVDISMAERSLSLLRRVSSGGMLSGKCRPNCKFSRSMAQPPPPHPPHMVNLRGLQCGHP